MGKQSNTKKIANRLRELLEELGRWLNPPKPVPVRAPAPHVPKR